VLGAVYHELALGNTSSAVREVVKALSEATAGPAGLIPAQRHARQPPDIGDQIQALFAMVYKYTVVGIAVAAYGIRHPSVSHVQPFLEVVLCAYGVSRCTPMIINRSTYRCSRIPVLDYLLVWYCVIAVASGFH
jgi:hypothetical protein